MPGRSQDEMLMREALALAAQGCALTSPNPCVGAVVTDAAGNVVGRGSHTYDGVKHGEVLALEQAGAKAKGGTLYLNLEPCSHQGRTPPCTAAVIASGVRRVVAAMRDPNPQVAGSGFEQLRAAGIDVTEGLLQAEARRLNEGFAKWIRTRLPLVTLKAAITLDGKIAPPPGGAHAVSHSPTALGSGSASTTYITSEAARAHVQELRHAADAIMVGVGTIVADDPLLTDRTLRPRRRPLQRVVLDSRLRLPLESRVVKTAKSDVIVFCSFAEEKKKKALESLGVRVEQVKLGSADGRPDMQQIVARLGELELTSLLIEGGALVNWAALSSGVVDKVFLYYAPKILAGTGSIPFAAGPGFRHMSDAAYVKHFELHRFGEDFAVEGYLRDPYEGI
ncbi:MAG: bifunctional diaminohydroxyphosphoribosylaminopyrimidine deaminase/5-amino-6-(5-phosphoribosylamino)uracil reductase RibD [Candidatus Koribacter versatilis]|uniref:Riboflavin biosynthesis protein RibD n=1 Tax=Candidatus Korobacter versatilis TaxID=658062 RepID=A0A932A626_9BACT|nr:bifunctional diaminohydroxyphosphoribosylaminopyrimidine deaminase/5-amino-6-(5-phosphoribosylamino)uracil reductase RibD [Candidatus Koribacter versatilis]